MEWVPIMKVARELGMSRNGLSSVIERGDLEFRFKETLGRKTYEISRDSVERYKMLIAKGERRNNAIRRRSTSVDRRHKNRGYVLVYKPEHPRAMCDGYVYEQWLVMEAHIGRFLTKEETVHHKNRVRDDNRIENLHLYASRAEHMREAHSEIREYLKNLNRLPIDKSWGHDPIN